MYFESLAEEKTPEGLALKLAYGNAIMAKTMKKITYPCKSVSVIIPSRLAKNPLGKYWFEDAVESILKQNIRSELTIEALVCCDEDSETLNYQNVTFIKSKTKSQAGALNAGLDAAQGEVITFLEDDDTWHPKRLDYSIVALNTFDFVSCNQLEFIVDKSGIKIFQNINDCATPSGWMVKRDYFNQIGKFDESFKWHLDTEWLGRLNRAGAKRCHFVEKGCQLNSMDSIIGTRSRLAQMMYNSSLGSAIVNTAEEYPLVFRATHEGSGMSKIATDSEANKLSLEEHSRIRKMNNGVNPW